MTDDYLKTIVQYLIKIVNNSGVSDKGISDKLDEVISAVSNIKISAESVNLNTDEVEAKLDTLNQSIIANGDKTDVIEKLTVLNTTVNNLGTKIDAIKTAVDLVNTTLGKLDAINTNISGVKTSVDGVKEDINATRESVNVVNTKLETVINNQTTIIQSMLSKGFVQPTHVKALPAGETTFEQNVVLCNITNDNITVEAQPADGTNIITMILTPGWNPVIVKYVNVAATDTIIYGY